QEKIRMNIEKDSKQFQSSQLRPDKYTTRVGTE
ncbi:uncharacterized protein METZ01_LOCUS93747, partial [marine metagenome]